MDDRAAARVRISDVSDALGLTKSTVSRALNDYPDIAEATRARVKKVARDMGYMPMAQAQAIRTGNARSIGLVLQIGDHDSHRPFLADFLAGISRAASAEHWTLTVAAAGSEDEIIDTMRRLTDERKADGFILPRTKYADRRIAVLRARGTPFILFGRTESPEGCAWYDILGEDAMRDAVARLAGLGHRDIAFVNGSHDYYYSGYREAGFLEGLRQAGLGSRDEWLVEDALTVEDGERSARRLMALPQPPTAIVCATDIVGIGVMKELMRRGLTPGREVSVIGYDGAPEGATFGSGLTTFAVDIRQAGMRLAEMLIARVRGADPETLRETAPASLVERGSDGPPALSAQELARRLAQDNDKN